MPDCIGAVERVEKEKIDAVNVDLVNVHGLQEASGRMPFFIFLFCFGWKNLLLFFLLLINVLD